MAIIGGDKKLIYRRQNAVREKLFGCVLVGLALLCNSLSPGAEQFGTADDAKAMLERAVEALKADKAAALKAFNDEKNKHFRDRDLYVFCFSLPDGNFTAYESPLLLGTNVRELKLPPNDLIGQRAYDESPTPPKELSLRWATTSRSPEPKAPRHKQSLEVHIGNQGCGVAYFSSQ